MKIHNLIAVVALVGIAGSAGAVSISFSNPLGELVDRRNVAVNVWADTATLDCSVPITVVREGNRFTLTARQAAPPPPNPPQCFVGPTAVLPPLPAGDYEVTAHVISVSGTTLESATKLLQIFPLEGRCNANPLLSPSLLALHKTLSAAQFAQLLYVLW